MDATPERLAYLAGIIDGEGTIAVFTSIHSAKGKQYPCYCPRLSVSNCDERLMLWLEGNFGGKARPVKRRRDAEGKWRQGYIWEAARRPATRIIQAVIPYLVIKKAQAELFLEFRKTTGRRNNYGVQGLPTNVIEMRQGIIDKIKFLNRRGPRAVVGTRCA